MRSRSTARYHRPSFDVLEGRDVPSSILHEAPVLRKSQGETGGEVHHHGHNGHHHHHQGENHNGNHHNHHQNGEAGGSNGDT